MERVSERTALKAERYCEVCNRNNRGLVDATSQEQKRHAVGSSKVDIALRIALTLPVSNCILVSRSSVT